MVCERLGLEVFFQLIQWLIIIIGQRTLSAMNKSPDLVLVLVVAFIVGAVMTGISQSDLQLASMVQQAFNS